MESFQLTQNDVGEGRTAFVHAELKVMQQRIDVRGSDIRIGRQIVRGVKRDRGIASPCQPNWVPSGTATVASSISWTDRG